MERLQEKNPSSTLPESGGSLDNGAFGGGEVDGLDPRGQIALQVLEDVEGGVLSRRVVEQLLERLKLDQDRHVLQEVALDVGGQLLCLQELMGRRDKCVRQREGQGHP